MTARGEDIGQETLRRMRQVDRYSAWVLERITPWTGDVVLEVGSGIGTFSEAFLGKKKLIVSDIRPEYLTILRDRFAKNDNVEYETFDLEGGGAHLRDRGVDTVIALNVLEHIDDDVNALTEVAAILAPGGRVILQLPAHPSLFNPLDHNLDHFRRYSMRDIRQKFAQAGLTPVHLSRMNMAGALGWFAFGTVLRRPILPLSPLGLFNDLTPAFIAVERIIHPPFGLSIIAVGQKAG